MTDRRGFIARASAALAALAAGKHIPKAEAIDVPLAPVSGIAESALPALVVAPSSDGKHERTTLSYVGGLPNGTVRLDGIDVTDVSSIEIIVANPASTSRIARGRGEVVTWIPMRGRDFDGCMMEPTGLQEFSYHGWVEFERPLEWRGHNWLKDSE